MPLSVCFRNRDGSYAGYYTSRYRELCAHLSVIATDNNRGIAHENGAIDGRHPHWKHRLEQLSRQGLLEVILRASPPPVSSPAA